MEKQKKLEAENIILNPEGRTEQIKRKNMRKGEKKMSRQRDLSPDAKIRIGEHLAYGIGGGFATNAVNLFIGAFLLIFYTEIMHVNPGVAASIIGVSKILDGLSDLIAGRVIDRTHHKMGKARIWLLRMIPVTIACLFLMYLMPANLTGLAQIAYMFITYNLVSTVCYTVTFVAFSSLNGLMTMNQASRGLNGGINMVGNALAALIGNSTIITFLKLLSDNPEYSAYGDRAGWVKLLTVWMIVGALAQLAIVVFTRERVKDTVSEMEKTVEQEKKDVSVLKTLKALIKNKYWICVIVIGFAVNFLMGATGSTSSYYMTYVLGDAEFYQIFSLVNTLAMIVAMLLTFGIMIKIGKRNTVIIGMAIRMIGSILPFISNEKPILVAAGLLAGVGYGVAGCAFASMIQDVLTYGEWKNGFKMIGMGNAANSFCGKIGNSFGTMVLGWVMTGTGFVTGAAVQSASAQSGLSFMFIWLPAVFSLISLIAAIVYDLDKIYPQIASDLKEGKYAPGVEVKETGK